MNYLNTGRFDASALRKENEPSAQVVPFRREVASAERTHIEKAIAQKRSQIAQLAQEVRWLTLELES